MSENLPAIQGAPRSVAGLTHATPIAIVPTNFDEVYRMSQAVANSRLAPHGMDTAEQISVAILTGLELGVKPMQAIQGIAVINGRPCVWGDLALAICRGTGEVEYITETFEGDEPEDWSLADQPKEARKFKAVCKVKRRGQPEVVNTYSIGDAITAKLWLKKGYNGKDTPWVTNPKRMMKMRARGFSLRDLFTDALKGLYIAEELQGEEPIDNRAPAAPPPPAEVQAALSAPKAAEQPAATKPKGPQAPPAPAEQPVDAELVEQPAEPAKEPEKAALAPEPSPAPQHDEPTSTFDVAGFLAEAEEIFAGCQTETDVNEAHEQLGDQVEAYLSRPQRETYAEMHASALVRVTKAPAAEEPKPQLETGSQAATESKALPASLDDEDDEAPMPEPEPHHIAAADLQRALDNTSSAEEFRKTWIAENKKLGEMVKRGTMTAEFRAELKAKHSARYGELLEAETSAASRVAVEQPAEKKPEPEKPAGGGDPELSAFVDEFRAKLDEITDLNALNDYINTTLIRRNKLREKFGDAADVLRVMMSKARERLS